MGKFPYLKFFRIYTQKTPAEVHDILKGETAVWGMGHFPLGDGVFVGEVGTSYFKVVPRPTRLQKTYSMAVMEGSIKAEAGETVVDLKMRFPWQVYLLFPAIILLLIGFVLSEGPFPPVIDKLLVGFIFFVEVIFWIYARTEFAFDAGRARRDMEKLFGKAVDID